MFHTSNFGYYITSIWEYIIASSLVLMLLTFSFIYQKYKQSKCPEYKYYTLALFLKLFGSFLFFLVYAYYYSGGDTTTYFENGLIFRELFYVDFLNFLKAYFSPASVQNIELFRPSGVFPLFETYFNEKTLFVVKASVPFVIISNGSFLISSILIGYAFFIPFWSLYRAFITICPNYAYAFISCFAIPSVIFWAGGISKDTITLAGVSILITQLLLFKNKKRYEMFFLGLKVLFGIFLVINTKPYIIIALFPSFLIWLMSSFVKNRISNQWLKAFVFPVFLFVGIALSYFVLELFGESLDRFAIDRALETAVATQQDLKQDYYKGQSFDIGDFEPTIESVISKIPIATFAGMFYPLPGQVSGLIPNFSVLENLIVISIIIYLLFNRYLLQLKYKVDDRTRDYLTFFLIYSFLFAFIIGLSTSNFGALVRFRIPMSPFFLMVLLAHTHYFKTRLEGLKTFK